MADKEVVYRALADFSALRRSSAEARGAIRDLRQEERAYNRESVAGSAASSRARRSATQELVAQGRSYASATPAIRSHTAALLANAAASRLAAKEYAASRRAISGSLGSTGQVEKSITDIYRASVSTAPAVRELASGVGSVGDAADDSRRSVRVIVGEVISLRDASRDATKSTEELSRAYTSLRRSPLALPPGRPPMPTPGPRPDLPFPTRPGGGAPGAGGGGGGGGGGGATPKIPNPDPSNFIGKLSANIQIMIVLLGVAATAVGPLVSAVGSLLGPVLGVVNAVGSLAGSVLALPTVIAAAITAVGAMVVATRGLGEAFKAYGAIQDAANKGLADGGKAVAEATEEYERALAELSPSARSVVTELIGMSSAWETVRRSTQEAFFSRIVDNIDDLAGPGGLPILNRLLTASAGALGLVASRGIEMLTSPPFSRDFGSIADSNVGIIDTMGGALLSVLDIMRNLAVATIPFVQLVAGDLARGAENMADFVQEARDTGDIARFMELVRDRFSQVWGIVKDLTEGVVSLAVASQDYTDWMLDGLSRLSGAWRSMTRDQMEAGSPLREFLTDSQPLLESVVYFVGELARGLAEIASNPENMIQAERIFTRLADDIIPKLVDLINTLAASGAFDQVLGLLSGLLDVVNGLADAMGPQALGLVLTTFTAIAAVSFVSQIAGVRALGDAIVWLGKVTGITEIIMFNLRAAAALYGPGILAAIKGLGPKITTTIATMLGPRIVGMLATAGAAAGTAWGTAMAAAAAAAVPAAVVGIGLAIGAAIGYGIEQATQKITGSKLSDWISGGVDKLMGNSLGSDGLTDAERRDNEEFIKQQAARRDAAVDASSGIRNARVSETSGMRASTAAIASSIPTIDSLGKSLRRAAAEHTSMIAALKETTSRYLEARSAARKYANDIVDATDALADAQQNQARVFQDASQNRRDNQRRLEDSSLRVTDSEKALAEAQDRTRVAQVDLTKARKEALADLVALREEVRRSAQSEENSQANLAQARENYLKVLSDPRYSEADRLTAIARLHDAENELADTRKKNSENAKKLREEEAKGVEGSDRVRNAVSSQKDARDAEVRARRELKRAREDEISTLADVRRSNEDQARAQRDATKAVRDARLALIELRETQQAPTRDAASKTLADAQRDVDAALKANGRTLDTSTEKGRDNEAALDGMASAALRYMDTLVDAKGRRLPEFDRALKTTRESLIKDARALGMSRDAAAKYAEQILAVPIKQATSVELKGVTVAKRDADSYNKSLERIKDSKSPNKTITSNVVNAVSTKVEEPTGLSGITDRIGGAFASVKDRAVGFLEPIVDWFVALPDRIGDYLGDAAEATSDAFGDAVEWSLEKLTDLGDFYTEFPGNVARWLRALPGRMAENFGFAVGYSLERLSQLGEWFQALPGRVRRWVSGVSARIGAEFTEVKEAALRRLNEIGAWLRALPARAGRWIAGASTRIGREFTEVRDAALRRLGQIGAWLRALPGRAATWLRGLSGRVAAVFRAVATEATRRLGSILTWFRRLPDRVVGFLTGLPVAVETAIGGLVDVFETATDNILQFFKDLPDKIVEAVTSIPGKVGEVLGVPWNFITEKFSAGIEAGRAAAGGAYGGVVNHAGRVLTGYSGGGVTPGYAPGVDSLTVRVSPGEGLLVPEATRALGGVRGINAINRKFSSRRPASGHSFAGGGVADPMSNFLRSVNLTSPRPATPLSMAATSAPGVSSSSGAPYIGTVIIHNPKTEESEESLAKTSRKLSFIEGWGG